MLATIFIIGLGYLIIQRILAIRQSYVCPPIADIRNYFEGRLKRRNKEAYDHLIVHLGVCEKCQSKMEAMAKGNLSDEEIEAHLISED